MKKHILAITLLTVSASACTFNLGTTPETSSNTKPATTTAENKPATTTNTAAAPKKEADAAKDAAAPKKEADAPENSDLTTSVVKPRTTRVQLAKGETSTSVTRDIPPNGSFAFLINAQKGQTIEYTVGYDSEDSDLTVYLGEPGDQDASIPAAPKAPQTFVVKKSGDHLLDVTNTTKKKVTITLYLDVQ